MALLIVITVLLTSSSYIHCYIYGINCMSINRYYDNGLRYVHRYSTGSSIRSINNKNNHNNHHHNNHRRDTKISSSSGSSLLFIDSTTLSLIAGAVGGAIGVGNNRCKQLYIQSYIHA